MAKIRAGRERREAEQRREPALPDDAAPVIDEQEQRSFADGDARMLLLKRGADASASNAQAVVDATSGIIVATALTHAAPDVGHLPGLVGRIRDRRAVAALPRTEATTASAEAGYCSTETIADDGDGIALLIAAGRDDPATTAVPEGGVWPVDVFGFDAARDVWVCPAGTLLTGQVSAPGTRGRPAKDRSHADPLDCAPGACRARCLKPGQDHRVLVTPRSRPTGAMRYKLPQPVNRQRYARRTVIVEPVFGQRKETRGFTTLSLRGLALAKAAYLLACLAHHLGKLRRIWPLGAASLAPAAGAERPGGAPSCPTEGTRTYDPAPSVA